MVVAIPIVYFVTALVVDYVLNWLRGFDAFTDQARVICDGPVVVTLSHRWWWTVRLVLNWWRMLLVAALRCL